MKHEIHQWDQHIRQSLHAYKAPPPPHNWRAIQAKLKELEATAPNGRRQRRFCCCASMLMACWLLFGLPLNNAVTAPRHPMPAAVTAIPNFALPTGAVGSEIKAPFNDRQPVNVGESQGVANREVAGSMPLSAQHSAKQLLSQKWKPATNMLFPFTGNLLFSSPLLLPETTPNLATAAAETASQPTQTMHVHHSMAGSRFSVSPYFSFDYIANRTRQRVGTSQGRTPVSGLEKPDLSYTTGLLTDYAVSSRITLQSGLLLSNSFTAVSATTVSALRNDNGRYTFELPTLYGMAQIKRSATAEPQQGDSLRLTNGALQMTTLTLPLQAKLCLREKNPAISATAGLALHHISRNRAEVEYISGSHTEWEVTETIKGVRKNYYSLLAGAELSYNLHKNISAGINPSIRYAVRSINQGTPVTSFPVVLSAGTFVRIRL